MWNFSRDLLFAGCQWTPIAQPRCAARLRAMAPKRLHMRRAPSFAAAHLLRLRVLRLLTSRFRVRIPVPEPLGAVFSARGRRFRDGFAAGLWLQNGGL